MSGNVPQRLVVSVDYLKRKGHPTSPQALTEHDCLVHALKSPTNVWSFTGADGHKSTVRVKGRLRSNFGEPLRHAALSGHGISMHP